MEWYQQLNNNVPQYDNWEIKMQGSTASVGQIGGPVRETEIRRELDGLSSVISRLQELAANLRVGLAPILPEVEPATGESLLQSKASTKLGAEIQAASIRLLTVEDSIKYLLENIEL